MSVVLTILKIIGFALLGLLALLAIALFVPVTVYISYERSRLLARVGALWLKFDLYDSDKPPAPKEKKEAAGAPPETAAEAPAPKTELDAGLIRALIGAGGGAAARVLRGLHIKHIVIVLVASGFDPYETGVNTGKMWGGLGALLTLLRSVWRDLGVDTLEVIPDFMKQNKGGERLGCEISATPFTFVCAACIFGWRFLKYKISKRREERAAKTSERTCLQ